MGLVKKVAFSAVAVVLCLALLEGVLALAGIRPEPFESDPYVGFSSQNPLFVEEPGPDGQPWMVTAKNKLEFFNPQRFPRRKEPGTFRIFSLGGSTAYGHPYSDPTSFSGWLREFLATTAPGRRWEVINAGGISYASYREARLMEELIRYQPDLFVVYGSHNEFLERRLYGRISQAPRVVHWLAGLARHSRFATLVKRTAAGLGRAGTTVAPSQKLASEPDTILEKTLGPTSYTRDDEARAQTFRHYQFNLGRMVDIARSAGARIIFIIPASNLREASPFKSEHRQGLSEGDKRRWQELLTRARQDYTNAVPTNALADLAEAETIDNRAADLYFARGRVLEKLGRYPEAKAAYERARDEDVCPLRAPGEIRRILTQVATERQVPLVDFEAVLEPRCEHGILGSAVFLDHVHTTIEGYRLLALEILKTMEKQGLVQPNWDAAGIDRTTREVVGRLGTRAQSLGLMNLCKTLGWAGKREEAYRAGRRAAELGGDIAQVQYEAGLAADLAGHRDEAVTHYEQALELKPDLADAHCNLGMIREERGQLREAVSHFRLARQYGSPKDIARNQGNLDRALAKLGAPRP